MFIKEKSLRSTHIAGQLHRREYTKCDYTNVQSASLEAGESEAGVMIGWFVCLSWPANASNPHMVSL
jgi:hypothetical protein